MSKHLLALALVVALAVVLTGCGGGNGTATGESAAIRDSINGYVDAYNARDYQKCLSYLTGWDSSSSEDDRISVIQLARGFSGQMTVEKIGDITISGSTATARVTSSWENPDADGKYTNAPGAEVNLKKDGGTWKLEICSVGAVSLLSLNAVSYCTVVDLGRFNPLPPIFGGRLWKLGDTPKLPVAGGCTFSVERSSFLSLDGRG